MDASPAMTGNFSCAGSRRSRWTGRRHSMATSSTSTMNSQSQVISRQEQKMSADFVRIIRKLWLLPLGALLCVALGGWDEDELRYQYRGHGDKVTRGAGNASAANIA